MHYHWTIIKASSLSLHQGRLYIETPLSALSDNTPNPDRHLLICLKLDVLNKAVV